MRIRPPIPMARLAALLCSVATALALPAVAHADAFAPAAGDVLTGVSGLGSVSAFAAQVGKRPAVLGSFKNWGSPLRDAFGEADASGTGLVLNISTGGYGNREIITPQAIASGGGDGYLIGLNGRIADRGAPVFVRFDAEMNQSNNDYCAFDQSGRSRGPAHSAQAFKQAWRRVALILRGGPVADIDGRLRALGLPALNTSEASLPPAPVSLMWVPQVAGTPDTAANSAAAYWPGAAYVDWVGTDFYSKYPNYAGLERFYNQFRDKPFVFGEWALWGPDAPGWVDQLFAFMRSHARVQMALYNQGMNPDGPFRLRRFPAALRAIRRGIAGPRFLTHDASLLPSAPTTAAVSRRAA
jgi:hypothetical protein